MSGRFPEHIYAKKHQVEDGGTYLTAGTAEQLHELVEGDEGDTIVARYRLVGVGAVHVDPAYYVEDCGNV